MMNKAVVNFFPCCNYACDYCSQHQHNSAGNWGRLATRESIRTLVDYFTPADAWELKLLGGEISIHPHFLELCTAVAERHHLALFTNLSFAVEPFLRAVPVKRITHISTSLQPEAEKNLEVFIAKVLACKAAGVLIGVSYVCTPERLARVPGLLERFRQLDVPFCISGIVGEYNGKLYPAAYTPEEKNFIRNNSRHYPAILMLDLNLTTYPLGELCSAGYNRVIVDGMTGEVKPCVHLPAIGNLFTRPLRLFPAPVICPLTACNSCNVFDTLDDFSNRRLVPHYYRQEPIAAAAWQEFLHIATRNRQRAGRLAEVIRTQAAGRELLVWGTGAAARQALPQLRQTGLTVTGLVDNDCAMAGQEIAGVRVLAARDVVSRAAGQRPYIVIASQYAHEIALQLQQAGYVWENDFCYQVPASACSAEGAAARK